MIAKLTGVIDSVGPQFVVIDVNGVGYLVSASSRTLGRIGNTGDPVSLLTETQVREDDISLYGFADAEEREWFRILCKVQGVGTRVALSILSILPPEQLPIVIAAQDKAAVQRADGVGPKLATRIITELKEKAGDMALGAAATQKAGDAMAGAVNAPQEGAKPAGGIAGNANSDAVSALVNLGYGRAEAFGAVAAVAAQLGDQAEDVSALIKASLKELSA